jgi:diguanylate cyclase (GGDEF)-like protein
MSAKSPQENEWQSTQDRLAESSGLAIVVVDETSPDLTKSNNNSICQVLYNSDEFAPECAKFCGRAFEWATEAGKTVEYKCYAGLNCLAVPVETETKQLVAIVGRTFLKAEDYRAATTRAISGDWQKFPPTKFFENVLLSSSMQSLETTAKQIESLNSEEKDSLLQIAKEPQTNKESGIIAKTIVEDKISENFDGKIAEEQARENGGQEASQANEIARLVEQFQDDAEDSSIIFEKLSRQNGEEAGEISEWRSLFGSLLNLSYSQACESISHFVSRRYAVSSLAWLERKRNRLEPAFASGQFQAVQLQLSISADDERLLDAVKKETSLELRERQGVDETHAPHTIHLFPIAVGNEIRSALIVGDEIPSENIKRHISRFCQRIASQLEISRLREQLNRRDWLERAVQKFNESVKDIDTDDFWSSIVQISAELMRAERSSILVFDEKSNSLSAKAATGARADIIKRETENLGERIAQKVLQTGKPMLIQDIRETKISAAPVEWNYKSNSFIICPIIVGRRKIGVLNITDRVAGENFSELDLEILNAIMPQLAVLIDRELLKNKAGEFEQLSVTDALTGLMNFRYLEARLAEEIGRAKRVKRDDFQVSFMTIDVDNFKSYNDNFGHPEGNKALKLVAHCLKDKLRGVDVAARVGGEEFSILLPQTGLGEAAMIAERIREKVESTEFPNRRVTVSIGVASCPNNKCTVEEITKWADDALYEAKRRGRNNVQIYENFNNDEG